jgi:hypothetical protein
VTRVVKVELQADVASYISEVLEADKATDGLDRKVEDLDKDVDKLGRDSTKAGAEVGLLGEEAKKTGNDVDDLGKKTGASAEQTSKFDKRIGELKTSMRDLAAEFQRTGDPALLKKFRADSSELAGLTKMRKELGGLTGDVGKLGSEAEKAESSVTSLFETPGLMQVGIGVGAALAVPALAGAGGALTAGAGIGAVGAGVAGAVAGDPARFKAEWGSAIGEIKKDWIDASQPFTGPTLDAIRSVGPMVDSWHLDTTFQKASTFVAPLVSGIEGFVTAVEGGVAKLVDNAGPVIATLETDLPAFGAMIADGLGAIADNAHGGAQALGDIIQLAGGVTDAVLQTVAAAEALYGGFKSADAAAANFIRNNQAALHNITFGLSDLALKASDAFNSDEVKTYGKALDGVALSGNLAADQAKATAADFAALSTTLKSTRVDADSLAASMVDKLFQGMMNLDQATLSWHESLVSVAAAMKTNGRTLDINTKQGDANREAILRAVTANEQMYQAQMNAGMKAEDAARNYDDNTAALERQLRKAGLTAAQIDGLIGKYRGIPDRVDTAIAVEGLTNAINDLDDLLRRLNGLPSRKDITIYTHTGSVGGKESGAAYSGGGTTSSATSPHGLTPHAAGGMLSPGWNLLGEEGPELEYNGMIYPAPQTRSMMASNSGVFAAARAPSGPLQLVYNGTVGGLEAMHLSWLAEASRQGQLQIHAKSVVA